MVLLIVLSLDSTDPRRKDRLPLERRRRGRDDPAYPVIPPSHLYPLFYSHCLPFPRTVSSPPISSSTNHPHQLLLSFLNLFTGLGTRSAKGSRWFLSQDKEREWWQEAAGEWSVWVICMRKALKLVIESRKGQRSDSFYHSTQRVQIFNCLYTIYSFYCYKTGLGTEKEWIVRVDCTWDVEIEGRL